jgi:hypothetical protein
MIRLGHLGIGFGEVGGELRSLSLRCSSSQLGVVSLGKAMVTSGRLRADWVDVLRKGQRAEAS